MILRCCKGRDCVSNVVNYCGNPSEWVAPAFASPRSCKRSQPKRARASQASQSFRFRPPLSSRNQRRSSRPAYSCQRSGTQSAAGKYLAQLGPLPQIQLQWKSAQPRPIRTEVRAESITLLDLRHEQPQAWTRLVVGQSLPNAESVEIEAPSDWQPLGVNWRDAVLQNVTNSSTLAKRRYRLIWNRRPGPAADERNPHRIEIYWFPSLAMEAC